MSLPHILLDTGTTTPEMYLKNAFGDGYGNEKNSNTKKLLLLFKDYYLYNIIWPGKSNIIFNRTKL